MLNVKDTRVFPYLRCALWAATECYDAKDIEIED